MRRLTQWKLLNVISGSLQTLQAYWHGFKIQRDNGRINKYCNLWFKNSFYLLMRKDVDFRHDTIVKPELLEKEGIKLEDIAFVLEDRNSMVVKWREMGLICLQVAEGDF